MQSNTRRTITARSMLPACVNRPTALRQFPRFAIAAVASVALFGPGTACAADVIQELVLPLVQAGAVGVQTLDDASDPYKLFVQATAKGGGATAVAGVGATDYAWADAPGGSAGSGWVWIEFTVEDPQHRPQVKTILDFNGIGETAPDPQGSSRLAGASWSVVLGPSDGGTFYLRIHDDLSSTIEGGAHFVGTPLFQLDMYIGSGDGGYCFSQIDMNGQRVKSNYKVTGCTLITEGGSLDMTHAPGTYLMRVYVDAVDNSTIVGDPVWRPHPDNPDVIVRRHAPTGSPGTPLAGINPADLAARGIDPTPFIAAGFFDPPSTPPPPSGGGGSTPPPPAPKYWCGPGFWLKNAADFGASAWPQSERTYYDYNSTAGQRAGCPIATGNPTLLQVLQNAGGYFSTQLKSAGFNCIGDYLSGKSGLLGTMTDNNGVCSIDQFGRQMQ